MKKLKTTEMNRLTPDEFRNASKIPVVVVLDNIRSQNNIGSVFRTADAFRIERIYLCGITATPPHREIHKTALGATESVSWTYFPETIRAIEQLRREGYIISGIEQTTTSQQLNLFRPMKGEKYALIFGNEVDGVSEEVMQHVDGC